MEVVSSFSVKYSNLLIVSVVCTNYCLQRRPLTVKLLLLIVVVSYFQTLMEGNGKVEM